MASNRNISSCILFAKSYSEENEHHLRQSILEATKDILNADIWKSDDMVEFVTSIENTIVISSLDQISIPWFDIVTLLYNDIVKCNEKCKAIDIYFEQLLNMFAELCSNNWFHFRVSILMLQHDHQNGYQPIIGDILKYRLNMKRCIGFFFLNSTLLQLNPHEEEAVLVEYFRFGDRRCKDMILSFTEDEKTKDVITRFYPRLLEIINNYRRPVHQMEASFYNGYVLADETVMRDCIERIHVHKPINMQLPVFKPLFLPGDTMVQFYQSSVKCIKKLEDELISSLIKWQKFKHKRPFRHTPTPLCFIDKVPRCGCDIDLDQYCDSVLQLLLTLCGKSCVHFDINTRVWAYDASPAESVIYMAMHKQLYNCTITLLGHSPKLELVSKSGIGRLLKGMSADTEFALKLIQLMSKCDYKDYRKSFFEWTDDSGYTLLHRMGIRTSFDGSVMNTLDTEIVETLCKNMRTVDPKTCNGTTPLMLYIATSNYELTKTILKYGADVNIVSRDGDTPMLCAIKTGDSKLIDLLIHNGARSLGFKCMDVLGHTSLQTQVDAWLIHPFASKLSIYSTTNHFFTNCVRTNTPVDLFTSRLYGAPLVMYCAVDRYITRRIWGLVSDVIQYIEEYTGWTIKCQLGGSCKEGTKIGVMNEFDVLCISNSYKGDVRVEFANALSCALYDIQKGTQHPHLQVESIVFTSGPAFKLKVDVHLPDQTRFNCSIDIVPVRKRRFNSKAIDIFSYLENQHISEFGDYSDRNISFDHRIKVVVNSVCREPYFIDLVSGPIRSSYSVCRQEAEIMNKCAYQFKLGYIMAKLLKMMVLTGHIVTSNLSSLPQQSLLSLYNHNALANYDSYQIKTSNWYVLYEMNRYTNIVYHYPFRKRYKCKRKPRVNKQLPNDPGLLDQGFIHACRILRRMRTGWSGLEKSADDKELNTILDKMEVYSVAEDYEAQTRDEVSAVRGDFIVSPRLLGPEYAYGTVVNTGERGLIPKTYIRKVKEGEYKAVTSHSPEMSDEILLPDKSMCIDVIDHGWMLGTVPRTGNRGLIPLHCVSTCLQTRFPT